jgi:hypothetical protein
MRHQWVMRSQPGQCNACRRPAGGPLYFCLWCKTQVHALCRVGTPQGCHFGRHALSTLAVRAEFFVALLCLLSFYPARISHAANPLLADEHRPLQYAQGCR